MSVTTANHNSLMPQTMDQAARLAEMMSKGKLVPTHLQSSPGDCLMVIEQAARWGMSPFAVAQCTSVIQGKLMFEGKLVAAALHTSGALSTRLDYQYFGEGADRKITVSAILAGETKPRSIDVKLADAKTNNGMWTKQPDQQLAYHGARVWARRYAPEVMLGVYAPEEMDAPLAPTPQPHNGTTIDGKAEPASAPTFYERTVMAVQKIADMAPTTENVAKAERVTAKLMAELDEAGETANKEALVMALANMRADAETRIGTA